MNPLTFILALLLFQAVCIFGAALFFARTKKGEPSTSARNEPSGYELDHETYQPTAGLMFDSDASANSDSLSRY